MPTRRLTTRHGTGQPPYVVPRQPVFCRRRRRRCWRSFTAFVRQVRRESFDWLPDVLSHDALHNLAKRTAPHTEALANYFISVAESRRTAAGKKPRPRQNEKMSAITRDK